MIPLTRLLTAMLLCVAALLGAPPPDLANRLANPATRSQAVADVTSSGNEVLPMLLELSRNPPRHLGRGDLFVGLADAFGALRAIEGTDFLINNIGLRRHFALEPWMKTPEIMEERLPAAAALIRIGARCLVPLMEHYHRWNPEHRLVCLFVMGRINDPTSRAFLESIMNQANAELSWARKAFEALPPER